MRILLIAAENTQSFAPGSAKAYPKVGILSLVAYLRANLPDAGRVEFRQHDMLLEDLEVEDIQAIIRDFDPDLVGISSLSYAEKAFHDVAAAVKGVAPRTLVVGGGPYVSSLRESVLNNPNVDILVFDEGERPFCELVARLLQGQDIETISGIAYRDRATGRPVSTRPADLIEDLGTLPVPAFDLVDLDRYASCNPHLDVPARFVPIVTSRGCPYQCVYCHALHGKRTRFRPADHVLDEIRHLYHDHGVRLFYVYDDIFNLDNPRAKEICRGIIADRLDLGIDFLNGLRGDLMDHELIDLMLDAGTYYFAYAIETATPRLQDLIKKYNRLDRVADAVEYTVEAGEGRCVVATYNMIGFPTETEEEVWSTVEFNRELPHHIADVAVAIPQENTAMFQMARDVGFQPPDERTPNYGQDVPLSASENISPPRLAELLTEFKVAFYDEARVARLQALARLRGPSSQTAFLGSFVRGYIGMSKAFLGDTNVALYTGAHPL